MREVEMTTQHLINDGFDIGTGRDPYKILFTLVFKRQPMFLTIEWRKWPKYGDNKLSKMCKMIAGDEMRHHHASAICKPIFSRLILEMMLAFQYMMKKIVMPAHFLRESGEKNKYCI
jgi:acyl-[acyl-carrier-protein] desaturase